MSIIPLFIIYTLVITNFTLSQPRITILPFQNMDGNLALNIWCYNLQDSLAKALIELDPNQEHFKIVPLDSVEVLLTEFNLDPTNPQYPSDIWKVVKLLNVQKVITGNFNTQAGYYLINAYVYDVRTKLPHPLYQAKDIFKTEKEIYDAVPIIVESIKGAFIK